MKKQQKTKRCNSAVFFFDLSKFLLILSMSASMTFSMPVYAAAEGNAPLPIINSDATPLLSKPQEFTDLPTSDAKHDINKSLAVDKLRLHSAVHLYSFQPIRLEVQYDQPITLDDALHYTLDNNLPIKISRENMNYQRYVLYSQLASALPNFAMNYNITHVRILNEKISSVAHVFSPRVTYPVFQGGSVLYSILGQYARKKGWDEAFKASINDALLDVYQKYNNLLLNRILLQIRAKAVEVSQEQLKVNQTMERAGTGTRFAVMQSETQLANDKQAFLQQQVTVRTAALALNFSLNYPMAVNLVPAEETIVEEALFQANASVEELVNLALQKRPDLREYELFRFAAGRNVQVAAAPLYPTLAFYTQFSYANTVVEPQLASSGSGTSGAGVFGGLFRTNQAGLALVWTLNGMGLVTVANIVAAQALARQSGVQANQALQTAFQQVRSSYLGWRVAREQIDNAATAVDSSAEELRLAELRLRQGVGTNLELIQAQRDYINALTSQAQAIVGSNLAQSQLLHDTGVISLDTLLHGYQGGAH